MLSNDSYQGSSFSKENYFDHLLNLTPSSVYWKDLSGIYLGCNLSMLGMVGLSSLKEIIGKTDYDLPWRGFADTLKKNDREVVQFGKLLHFEETGMLANGNIIVVISNKMPLVDQSGNVVGIIGSSIDITAIKQAERAKQKFLQDMAHDLRTPLAGIIGLSSLQAMGDTNTPEKIKTYGQMICGDDHLNNTPRQINLLLALGADLPLYSHVPMILGPDGKKLSKRHGAANILQYREEGYLPDALLNYLVRLGWSHDNQEIFSRQQMIECFDLHGLNKAPAAINPDKLVWLNQHYLRTDDLHQVTTLLRKELEDLGINTRSHEAPDLEELVVLQRERVKTLRDMAEKSLFFYTDPPIDQQVIQPEVLPAFRALYMSFSQLQDWTDVALHGVLLETASQFSLTLGKLVQPFRLMITGSTVSPPMNITLRLLGKSKVLRRMHRSMNQSES